MRHVSLEAVDIAELPYNRIRVNLLPGYRSQAQVERGRLIA